MLDYRKGKFSNGLNLFRIKIPITSLTKDFAALKKKQVPFLVLLSIQQKKNMNDMKLCLIIILVLFL